MGNREDFEEWWREAGIKFITEKTACLGAWQARQPEIDALKAGIDSREAVIADASNVIAALKAELERLRKVADHAEGFLFAVSLMPQLGPKVREVALKHHEALRAELNKDRSC